MPDAKTDSNNPNPQGSGNAGGEDRKLYAGKFTSLEEAVEKGYGGLEKGFHETRQELKELKDLIAARLPERSESGDGDSSYGQSDRSSYGVPSEADANVKVLQAFYQNPIQVLQEVANTTEQRVMEKLTKANSTRQQTAGAVEAWRANNKDIAAYGDLMQHYVGQTDPKLPIASRLDKAAEQVRKRVLELRQGRSSSGPGNEDHREAPSGDGGERQPAQRGGSQESDPEAEMKKYLSMRNVLRKPQRPGATP